MLNRVLEPLKELFKHEDSHIFLDILNEDDIPTTSDVVLIISQYKTAIEEFKNKYYFRDEHLVDSYGDPIFRWLTEEFPYHYYMEK